MVAETYQQVAVAQQAELLVRKLFTALAGAMTSKLTMLSSVSGREQAHVGYNQKSPGHNKTANGEHEGHDHDDVDQPLG